MNGEKRPLVTDKLVEVQVSGKITNPFLEESKDFTLYS
jgi:hypothetical protein